MNTRNIAAFMIAPLMPSMIIIFMMCFLNGEGKDLKTILFVLFFSLSISYISFAAGGILAIKILRKKKILSLYSLATTGFFLGLLFWYLFGFFIAFILDSSKELIPSLIDALWGGLFGLLVAVSYALIAGVGSNKNRSCRQDND